MHARKREATHRNEARQREAGIADHPTQGEKRRRPTRQKEMSDRFRGQQYAFGANQPTGSVWGGQPPAARPLLGAGGQSWASLQQRQRQRQQPQHLLQPGQQQEEEDGGGSDYDGLSGDEGEEVGAQSEGWSDAGSDNEDGADYNFIEGTDDLDGDQQWDNGAQRGYALPPLQVQPWQQYQGRW